jgi:glycosyltransferase involved in cell wall biosynthesis
VRVLILSPEPPPSGLLHSLVALGVEPIVARPRGETETDGLVRFERVTSRGNPEDPMDLRWSRKALRTLLRDLRPDLLHIIGDPWTPTAEAGAAAARDLKIPYVLVGHSCLGGPKGITARWQSRRVRDGAAGLAGAVAPALAFLADGANDGPRAVLPQIDFDIPARLEPRPDPESPTIGVFGRVAPERGLDLLFDALADVYGEWRLMIVGSGPEQESLEGQAQRLGLSSRIEWLGGLPRNEIGGLWERLDTIVAPSRTTEQWMEPTGSIVLEAMAYGLAAITSRSGALPDVVGDAGLIVDENDRPALSRAIQGLVERPERTRALGASARKRVLEHYGHGPIAERTARLWRASLPSSG